MLFQGQQYMLTQEHIQFMEHIRTRKCWVRFKDLCLNGQIHTEIVNMPILVSSLAADMVEWTYSLCTLSVHCIKVTALI